MSKVLTELTPEMMSVLQGQAIVLLNVVHKPSNTIYSTALSWVYAEDATKIRFAIDSKSDFITIIEEDPKLVMNFIALESVYSVVGTANVVVKETEDTTLKLTIVEVQIDQIRDIMFYGGKVTTNPEFIKTYKPELVVKLDEEAKQAVLSR
ncbi:hypothetical protein E0485_24910 [Paenibacillus albiflavus]|uniref:Pyridoxamine 5'-phosphate oxidase putative domain-containing protein n=1 Tax=Paenibacillus albiflavus TaxID=2545760 RepID=A0A4R4E0J9_9BACL|nr:hypothetical protein [Paenibacillus albiflavus]TCZ67579.1 hypothetical protein E0485_24910 [Paenibacillus albiflavus]